MAENLEKQLMNQFTVALSKLRYELEKNISEIDVLDRAKLRTVISLFDQRLVIFQQEFLSHLDQMSSETIRSLIGNPDRPDIGKKVVVISGGGTILGSALMLSLVVKTSGFLFWTKSITLGAFIGGKLGIPAGPWTCGFSILLGAFIGAAAVAIFVIVSRPWRRRVQKDLILRAFDGKVTTALKKWAREMIERKFHG